MMTASRWLHIALLGLVWPGAAAAVPGPDRPMPGGIARPGGAAVRDSLRRIDGNRVNMFVSGTGSLAFDLAGSGRGLIFPKGTDQSALFASGLWLGCKVGGQTRVVVAEYSSEYGPGPIVGGAPDDPLKPDHRVYKVVRPGSGVDDTAHVDRTAAERAADPYLDPLAHHAWSEYLNGAAPYGAPTRDHFFAVGFPNPVIVIVPGPDVVGDQMLWTVYNDADPALHMNPAGGSPPLGIEVQQSIFAFDQPENLCNTVFLRFRIIHKGTEVLDSVYVSLWGDPDLGGFGDDAVGCDTTRSLGFCYNALASDQVYGTPPPALGFLLLRGPVDRASGDTLRMTSFGEYVGGNDPASAAESYNVMRGLARNGDPFVDPVTGQTTRFAHPGDPVTGSGSLDSLAGNALTALSSGPFQMAPGDTQEVVAAITIGRGPDHLASVGVVRCQTDVAWSLYRAGFQPAGFAASPPCSTSASYTITNCPRTASFWAAEYTLGGGLLTAPQLQQVAERVDSLSALFDWPGTDVAEFRAAIDPPGAPDLRQEAHREYAALMASYGAGQLRIRTTGDEPIWLNRLTRLACATPPARTIGDLVRTASVTPRFLDASYLNDVFDHRRALEGVPAGLPAFLGGAGPAWDFLGSTLDPTTAPDSFMTVEIRFDRTTTLKAYRYLRLETQSTGGAPPQGRAYLYGGHRTVPFTCWDVQNNVQLDVGFVERTVTDDTGTILAPGFQPATFDSTWGPDDSPLGGHEVLIVFRRPYDPTPRAELARDGVLGTGGLPALYALWSRLRSASDVIDDGDRFRFLWGRPAQPSADSVLVDLEGRPLDDPAVQDAYRDLLACLQPVNAGLGIGASCTGTTPEAIFVAGVDAYPTHVVVTWFSAAATISASIERRFEGGGWSVVGQAVAGPDGLMIFNDTDVVAGGRYDYRLAVDTGGRVQYYGQVQVDVPGRSAFRFLGVRPNPVGANLVVSFSLASRAPARLELIDVTGRRVFVKDLAGIGAGGHVVDLGDSGRFPTGIYLVRITQEGRRVSGKAAIVR